MSDHVLAAAIEANLYHTLEYLLANWDASTFEQSPSLMWAITDTHFPLFNSIIGARLTPDEADERIMAIVAQGQQRGVP